MATAATSEHRHGALQGDHPTQDAHRCAAEPEQAERALAVVEAADHADREAAPGEGEAGDDDDVGQLLPAAQGVGEVALEIAGDVRRDPEVRVRRPRERCASAPARQPCRPCRRRSTPRGSRESLLEGHGRGGPDPRGGDRLRASGMKCPCHLGDGGAVGAPAVRRSGGPRTPPGRGRASRPGSRWIAVRAPHARRSSAARRTRAPGPDGRASRRRSVDSVAASTEPIGAGPRWTTIVVITPTATLVTKSASMRPLIARKPAFGLSARRRAAMSAAGRLARRAITRAPTMVSHGRRRPGRP